jgi:DNA polymerase-1
MKTLIIDGNNLIHRTFWTAKKVSAGNLDKLTNLHIYFTLNAISSYVKKYNPTKTIAVWDEKLEYTQNSRKTILPEYKGNRSADNSPHKNNDVIKRLIGNLGIVSIFPKEREADDIIAYICKTTTGSKVIASVDRDFLQLVDEKTTLFDPIRKREFNLDTFVEDTGYTRNEWLNAKCMLGDKSDNVPGIPGFGKAKVRKWLDGALTLTDEQEDIFTKNMTLFNLNEVMSHTEEKSYYQKQLEVEPTYNWSEFVTECSERELENILKKKEEWYNLFIMSNKLIQLLG